LHSKRCERKRKKFWQKAIYIDEYCFTAPIVIHVKEKGRERSKIPDYMHWKTQSLLMMAHMEIRASVIRFRKWWFTEETSLWYSNHSATTENAFVTVEKMSSGYGLIQSVVRYNDLYEPSTRNVSAKVLIAMAKWAIIKS